MDIGSGANRPGERAAGEDGLFLRRQVTPRRSARSRVRVALRAAAALFALAALVALGYWTASAAGRAPELVVSRVRVEGNRRLAEGEILGSLGLHSGSNILNLDLEAMKRQLLRSPWVKDVQISRVLPATLTLRIVERIPVGIAVLDRLYLMDGEGVFLDELGPRYAGLALPLIHGIAAADGHPLQDRAAFAAGVVRALDGNEQVRRAVSEIDVSGGEDSIRMTLRHPAVTILAEEENLVERLAETLPLLEGILRHFPSVEAVDLRFAGRVFLRLGSEPEDGDVPRGPGELGGR